MAKILTKISIVLFTSFFGSDHPNVTIKAHKISKKKFPQNFPQKFILFQTMNFSSSILSKLAAAFLFHFLILISIALFSPQNFGAWAKEGEPCTTNDDCANDEFCVLGACSDLHWNEMISPFIYFDNLYPLCGRSMLVINNVQFLCTFWRKKQWKILEFYHKKLNVLWTNFVENVLFHFPMT